MTLFFIITAAILAADFIKHLLKAAIKTYQENKKYKDN